MNSQIKRPRMTVNCWISSRKMVNLQSQIHEFADKKTAYNEVHLYWLELLKVSGKKQAFISILFLTFA